MTVHSQTFARTLNRFKCLAALYRFEIYHHQNKTTCLSDVNLHKPPTHKTHAAELSVRHFRLGPPSYFSGTSTTFSFFPPGFQSCWSTGQVVQLLLGQRVCSLGCAGFAINFMDSASITKKSQFTPGYSEKSPRLSEALFNTCVCVCTVPGMGG